jgi:hypothetical protein
MICFIKLRKKKSLSSLITKKGSENSNPQIHIRRMDMDILPVLQSHGSFL